MYELGSSLRWVSTWTVIVAGFPSAAVIRRR
jgi:hypothetical protein